MATEVACPNCRTRYAVTPALAGKQVRCKHCGTVFAVPAQVPAQHRPAPPQQSPGSQPHRPPYDSAAMSRISSNETIAAADYVEDEPNFDAAVPSDLQTAFWRPSRPFDFPLGRWLDRWLAPILFVGCAGWAVFESFRDDVTGRGW